MKNTSIRRVVAASTASGVGLLLSLLSQIAFVPLFLSEWDASTYGTWLILQAVVALLNILDVAHHDYVGFEMLRLGASKREEISSLISSAVPIAIGIGFCDLALVGAFALTDLPDRLFSGAHDFTIECLLALAFTEAVWIFTGPAAGVLSRALAPFGHLPILSWLGVLQALVASSVPAVAAALGAGILQATVAALLGSVAYFILLYVVLVRLLRRESLRLRPRRPRKDERQGRGALLISVRYLVDYLRQTGVRTILAPFVSPSSLASFATVRTVTNLASQGVGTVTSPMMPELMRFIVDRDQSRTESAIDMIWLFVLGVLAPGLIVLQLIAPATFDAWTQGKVQYDSMLLALLAAGVLAFAACQPAISILRGNNLLGVLLWLSSISAATGVAGMLILVPEFGLRGAAAALLIASTVELFAASKAAAVWMRREGLDWPATAFRLVVADIVAIAGALVLSARFGRPEVSSLSVMAVHVPLTMKLYRCLPIQMRDKLRRAGNRPRKTIDV